LPSLSRFNPQSRGIPYQHRPIEPINVPDDLGSDCWTRLNRVIGAHSEFRAFHAKGWLRAASRALPMPQPQDTRLVIRTGASSGPTSGIGFSPGTMRPRRRLSSRAWPSPQGWSRLSISRVCAITVDAIRRAMLRRGAFERPANRQGHANHRLRRSCLPCLWSTQAIVRL
jgi:hypothetical protein